MGEKIRERIFVCNNEKDQLAKYVELKKEPRYDVTTEWRFNKRCVVARLKEVK